MQQKFLISKALLHFLEQRSTIKEVTVCVCSGPLYIALMRHAAWILFIVVVVAGFVVAPIRKILTVVEQTIAAGGFKHLCRQHLFAIQFTRCRRKETLQRGTVVNRPTHLRKES